jgi:hypothetical protein
MIGNLVIHDRQIPRSLTAIKTAITDSIIYLCGMNES